MNLISLALLIAVFIVVFSMFSTIDKYVKTISSGVLDFSYAILACLLILVLGVIFSFMFSRADRYYGP